VPQQLGRTMGHACVDAWTSHHPQVLQSMTAEQRDALTPLKLRYKARDFAKKEVAAQREQFKRCAGCTAAQSPGTATQVHQRALSCGQHALT
jgi:hypothetical protein